MKKKQWLSILLVLALLITFIPTSTVKADELADGQIIADGVYYIQNMYSEYYMQVTDGSTQNNAYISHMDKNLDDDGDGELYLGISYDLRYMWKITYVGNGKYTIYSMNQLKMQLNLENFDWSIEPVAVASYNYFTPNPDGTPGDVLWSIMRDDNGYVIMQDGDITKTLFAQNINRSVQPTIVAAEYEENIAHCHWTFIEPTAQILLYSQTGSYLVNPTRVISIGDSKDLLALNILPHTCFELPENCTVSWTSQHPSIATVDMYTGCVTGISNGSTQITASVTYEGQTLNISYVISVVTVKDGLYYIRNRHTGYYVDSYITDPPAGTSPILYDARIGSRQQWIIEQVEDETYTIKPYKSDLYFGISSDGSCEPGLSVELRECSDDTLTESLGLLWKFNVTEDNNFKIIAQNGLSDSLVLTSSKPVDNLFPYLEQNIYTNNANYSDEWELIRFYPLTLDVYYDSYVEAYSDENDSGYFNIRNQLYALKDYYWEEFNIHISWTGVNKISTFIDECPNLSPSGYCNCGTCPETWNDAKNAPSGSTQHTNIRNILARIPGPKASSDVVVLFIGHETCAPINGSCRYGAYDGLTYKEHNRIAINHIADYGSSYDNEKCTQTLIHEIGHLFFAEDHYNVNGEWGDDMKNTDEMNEPYRYWKPYSENCIYGENRFEIANLTICNGCKDTIRKHRDEYEKLN